MDLENSPRLSRNSSAFALATAVTVLFNTALALAKDAVPSLNAFMKSLTGHHWTTHAIADLFVFFLLALIFSKTAVAEKISASSLITLLIGAVVLAALGLLGWYLVT